MKMRLAGTRFIQVLIGRDNNSNWMMDRAASQVSGILQICLSLPLNTAAGVPLQRAVLLDRQFIAGSFLRIPAMIATLNDGFQ